MYFRVFRIRLQYPEVGILFELVNRSNILLTTSIVEQTKPVTGIDKYITTKPAEVIDGPKFLIWFYKMGKLIVLIR
jgi:hypothetical protein